MDPITDNDTPAALAELHAAAHDPAAAATEGWQAPLERPKYAAETLPAEERANLTHPRAVCRVDLGDGQWAELRDVRSLKAGDRKAIISKIDDKAVGAIGVEMIDGVLALLIVGWSLPLPIPSANLASLSELELGQDDALNDHPVVQEAMAKITKRAPTPSEPSTDPASPSRPFNA